MTENNATTRWSLRPGASAEQTDVLPSDMTPAINSDVTGEPVAESVAETVPEQPSSTISRHEAIMQRKQARRAALEALFEIDSVGHEPGMVVDERLAALELGNSGVSLLRWLVSGVVRSQNGLDELIAKYAPEWPVDQLAIIDRNVLRLALYEIGAADTETPPKVVINEAVELAKLFGSDNSPRFVNGVLGAALDEARSRKF